MPQQVGGLMLPASRPPSRPARLFLSIPSTPIAPGQVPTPPGACLQQQRLCRGGHQHRAGVRAGGVRVRWEARACTAGARAVSPASDPTRGPHGLCRVASGVGGGWGWAESGIYSLVPAAAGGSSSAPSRRSSPPGHQGCARPTLPGAEARRSPPPPPWGRIGEYHGAHPPGTPFPAAAQLSPAPIAEEPRLPIPPVPFLLLLLLLDWHSRGWAK